jgi:hypothetical protein
MADQESPHTGEAPSGLPPDQPEEEPLGVPHASPEGEGERDRGDDAMPGVPSEGEPPAAG